MENVRAALEQSRKVGVTDAGLEEPKSGLACEAREIAFLDRTRIVVGEAVEAHDVDAVGDELLRERGTDEPGDAGDECAHYWKMCLTLSGRRRGRPSRSSDA
jgi:hypothetical protein